MNAPIAILVKRFPKLSETFILGEIENLARAGANVSIFSLYEPSDCVQQPGAERFMSRVTYLNRVSRLGACLSLLIALLVNPVQFAALARLATRDPRDLIRVGALLRSCRRHGIRHIHAHYVSESAALADAAAAIGKLTFSISAHAKDIYQTPNADIASRLSRSEFVATCTRYNFDHLRSLTTEHKDRVHLVYHGIDAEHFHPSPADDSQAPPLLLAVGRFKEKKGFDLLIDACAILAASSVDFRCEIIGYGDQEPRLRDLIRRHGLQHRVALRAPVDHAELQSIYGNATIFILPCRLASDGDRDGIPNAMLEAMASKLPVISTAVSGVPEVITDGVNGMLVAPDNAVDLAMAARILLADPQLRNNLGESGRRTVLERFSWHRNIPTLIGLLRQAEQKSHLRLRQAQ